MASCAGSSQPKTGTGAAGKRPRERPMTHILQAIGDLLPGLGLCGIGIGIGTVGVGLLRVSAAAEGAARAGETNGPKERSAR